MINNFRWWHFHFSRILELKVLKISCMHLASLCNSTFLRSTCLRFLNLQFNMNASLPEKKGYMI